MLSLVCYACKILLTPKNKSEEHIISNSIGGKLTSSKLLCIDCNNKFGRDYEAKFANQLNFFTGRLPIKKYRNSKYKANIKLNNDTVPIVIDNKGRPLLEFPFKLENASRIDGKSTFIVPIKDQENFIDKVKKRHPKCQISIEKNNSLSEGLYAESQIQIGGISFFKTAQKSLLNLYIHKDGDPAHITNEINNVFTPDKMPRIWFYSNEPPDGMKSNIHHILAIFGKPKEKILFGYVEFFGAIRLIGILNDNYSGAEVYFTHAVDPLKGLIIEAGVEIKATREELISLVNEKALNHSGLSAQLGLAESAVQNNHYCNNLADKVMDKISGYETWTREQIYSAFMEVLTPEILASSIRRNEEAQAKLRSLER